MSNKLLFRLGDEGGMYSEILNMIGCYFISQKKGIEFIMSSYNSQLFPEGWTDFFKPFCKEMFHQLDYLNRRSALINNPLYKKYLEENNINIVMNEVFWDYNKYVTHNLYNDLDINEGMHKTVRKIYQFNDKTEQEINKVIDEIHLPNKFVSMHIRRGDKIIENQYIPIEKYFELVPQNTQNIFIFTDDYKVIEEANQKYGDKYHIYTLANKDENGYNIHDFWSLSKENKKKRNIILFANMEILRRSDLCLCTYTTNTDCFLYFLIENNKLRDVEGKEMRYLN